MAKSKFTEQSVPDLTDKIIIVTGGNSGIGFEASKVFLKKNATVILACRNKARGEAAVEKLTLGVGLNDENKNRACFLELDLADLNSIEQFSINFLSKYDRLDVLVNNAGVMALKKRQETKDGFEMQFGTNHLGHFALTARLFECLKQTKGSRVVNVSSMVQNSTKGLDFSNMDRKKKYAPWKTYADSKLANMLFTHKLAALVKEKNYSITVSAAHPGFSNTNIQHSVPLHQVWNTMFAQSAKMGALPTVRAAVDDDAQAMYFGPRGLLNLRGYPIQNKPNKVSNNKDMQDQLWNLSVELTNLNME